MDKVIIEIGKIKAEQRMSDGFYNATALVKEWNKTNGVNKRIDGFLKNDNTIRFMDTLMGLHKVRKSDIVKEFKYEYTNGRPPADIYLHPYLFAEFVSWLSPENRIYANNVVYDRLKLQSEIKTKSRALSKLLENVGVSVKEVDSSINTLLFGKDEDGVRDDALNSVLKRICEFYDFLAMSVNLHTIDTNNAKSVLVNLFNKNTKN